MTPMITPTTKRPIAGFADLSWLLHLPDMIALNFDLAFRR